MNLESVTELLSALVSIDSVNPSLVPGAKGEAEIARFVGGWLEARGLEVTYQETGASGRPNVIAVARGAGGGRTLMLNAHLDTVGVAGMEAPFAASVRDGRLYGRGAQDTKSSLAAFMLAAVEARRLNLRGDVILAGVVDEEYASLGTQALVGSCVAEAAIVGEPTDLELAVAHKGFVWLEVETRGVAAHGSRPAEGVDAIVKMGKVLIELDELSGTLAHSGAHPLLGSGSVHASLIEGGHEMSSYPASCRLQVERRTLPGENAVTCEAELRRLLDGISARDADFAASVRSTFERPPLEASAGSPLVPLLLRRLGEQRGKAVQPSGITFWTDAALLNSAGIPSVVLGPSGGGLHGAVEWVELESVLRCARAVLATAQDFCG